MRKPLALPLNRPWASINKFSGFALAVAGLLVLSAAVWNQLEGGRVRSPAGSLALIAIAILLGIAAFVAAHPKQSIEFSASRGSAYRWVLPVLLGLHVFIACRLIGSPPPRIDTFSFQRDATATLLQGKDPFGGSHANPYNAFESHLLYGAGQVQNGRVQIGMPYPPVAFLCLVPGYLLGDVRYGYVAAIVLSSLFVYALFPDARGLSLAAAVLLAPVTYFVEYECWTEPVLWMLLCASVYAALKRPRWLPLTLGLFLAAKQYNFLALPLIGYLVRPFSWKAYGKLLLQSLSVALATVLPFAIWNFHALWHDLILNVFSVPVRQDALSFAIRFPVYATIGRLFLLAFFVWAARRKNKDASMFAAVYGLALMLFFSASRMAFLNYYFAAALSLWLTAASLWPAKSAQLPDGSSESHSTTGSLLTDLN